MSSGPKALEELPVFAVTGIEVCGSTGGSACHDTALARRAAQSNCTILITGETGAGKGHFAQWLHQNSRRSGTPFVPVNCGGIPEGIIDSQLFGHARGAFSGATRDHTGLVRAADGGTLFLDELSELPHSAQTRLLRLLQEREVQPVGYAKPVLVDVRVIGASNADLQQAVENNAFREDLLFRLNVIHLRVKPLRERPEELLTLLEKFNREFAESYGHEPLEFDRTAMSALQQYRWPGNVRQLRSLIERMHVLCPDEAISARHLVEFGQISDSTSRNGYASVTTMTQVKREAVSRVLNECEGSISRAAEVFGVHRSTIYRWLREH